jgi:hypothetical protein
MHGITKTSRSKFQGRCPICGEPFTRNTSGRRKRFCSDRCRDEARRARNFSVLGRCRGEPRNRAKSPCGTCTFFIENRGRASHGIVGPRYVIEVEIERAHSWTVELSGYAVAQPRKPALRS